MLVIDNYFFFSYVNLSTDVDVKYQDMAKYEKNVFFLFVIK